MNEYRCISCDYIKLSESSATCPECGYKMFPTPYNRKEVLIEEIQKFVKALMTEKNKRWIFFLLS